MDIEKQVIELIKLLLLLGGAFWGVYRFKVEGKHKPRVEFDVEANVIGMQNGAYAIEFVVLANNKGARTRSFEQITLTVRGVSFESELSDWDGNEPRLFFPKKLIDKAELVYKKNYGSIFVEPGVNQKITYFSKIPDSISLISVRAHFSYDDKKTHSAERMFKVGNA